MTPEQVREWCELMRTTSFEKPLRDRRLIAVFDRLEKGLVRTLWSVRT